MKMNRRILKINEQKILNTLSVICKISLVLLSWLIIMSSQAIIIRHDVGPARYEVRNSEYPAVFFLEQQGNRKVCAATVIHQQWALTAAHCIEQTLLANAMSNGLNFGVIVAGQQRGIDAVIIHPDFNMTANTDVDLALLRFRLPSASPNPVPLHLYDIELGATVSLLGWGYLGLGTTGRQYSDGSLRIAMNRVSEVDRRFKIEFDDPRASKRLALPLEGMPGLGDSGGPALLTTSTGLVLAGIAVGEIEGDNFSEETQGRYGAIAVYERVSQHIDWIETVIGSAVPFDS